MRSFFFSLLLIVCCGVVLCSCESTGYTQGAALYKQHCSNCHMMDGTGLGGNIPPLAGSDYFAANPAQTACIIQYGLQDTITVNGKTYKFPMAAIPTLNNLEIANIINYISNSWGNSLGYTSLDSVNQALTDCADSKE